MSTKKKAEKSPKNKVEWQEVSGLVKNSSVTLSDLKKSFESQPEFKKIVPEWMQCITKRLDKTQQLLITKGKEYSRHDERFWNFERAAHMNLESPVTSLHGMLTKHLVNYLDMVEEFQNEEFPSVEKIEERLGDIIVYFHLQEALMKKVIAEKK